MSSGPAAIFGIPPRAIPDAQHTKAHDHGAGKAAGATEATHFTAGSEALEAACAPVAAEATEGGETVVVAGDAGRLGVLARPGIFHFAVTTPSLLDPLPGSTFSFASSPEMTTARTARTAPKTPGRIRPSVPNGGPAEEHLDLVGRRCDRRRRCR